MEEEEIFKDIPNYEGYYQVSTLGRIKSLSRKINANGGVYLSKERILISRVNKKGYCFVALYKNNIRNDMSVHKIVSITFLGHKPCGQEIVPNHIDGDPLNNKLSNIALVTGRENSSVCFRKDRNIMSSKYPGVSWNKINKNWNAYINDYSHKINLGTFVTEEEAYMSYKYALAKIISHRLLDNKSKIV